MGEPLAFEGVIYASGLWARYRDTSNIYTAIVVGREYECSTPEFQIPGRRSSRLLLFEGGIAWGLWGWDTLLMMKKNEGSRVNM